jgi:hypothetical protein
MKYLSTGASGQQKMPNTQSVSLLNERLLVFIRAWNGSDINQKIIDEVSHYLSSVEADIELTNSFEYLENLTSLGNKMRAALILANEQIYRLENKELYKNGAEVLILYQKNSELAWGSVGRFSIEAVKNEKKIKLFDNGSRFDNDILLPVALLGLTKTPDLNIGGVSLKNLSRLQISSVFGEQETFWQSIITEFLY